MFFVCDNCYKSASSTSHHFSKNMSSKSKSTEPKTDRLALANALSTIASRGDAWIKSIEDFRSLRQELNQSLEDELQTKKRQREDIEVEYEQTKRAKKIDLEQELSQFGYQSALKLLAERKEVPIAEADLIQLRTRIKELEQKGDSELKKAVEEERTSAARSLAFEKRTLTLEHQKEIAALTAQAESLKQQLTSAKNEIEKAEARLDAQRELCRNIADSCKAPSIVQNLGK